MKLKLSDLTITSAAALANTREYFDRPLLEFANLRQSDIIDKNR